MSFRLWHVPLRVSTGAYILEQGLSKRDVDGQTAGWLHSRAVTAYPQLGSMDPERFARLLSTSEIALGAALLLPFVPSGVAGLGLLGFSGSLMRLYVRSPELHKEGSLRPNAQGVGLAKDAWMLGIALALVLDAVTGRGRGWKG